MLLLLAACSENEIVAKDGEVPEIVDTDAPDIEVTPTSIAFGDVAWDAEAVATVVIANVGTAALHLDDVRLESGTPELSWTALSSPIVPPGGQVETVLTWTPAGPGVLSDRLLIRSDDPDEAEVPVPIGGGVPFGEIQVDPANYDFGTLEVGALDTMTVTISNVGTGVLTIDDWTYAATDADLVVLDAGALTTMPAQLDPGESTDVVVQYAPSGAGGDEGNLSLSSDDPDTPSTGAQQLGNGAEPDPCEGFTQSVELFITADDQWEGWLDGTEFNAPNQYTWSAFDTLSWELDCGDHALSLHAQDTGAAISGVLAVVSVEGSVRFLSGPSNWTMLDTAPSAGWQDPSFDDSGWHIPEVCADASIWGSTPQPFYDLGAQWIWWTTDCRSLGEAWLRLNFTVP